MSDATVLPSTTTSKYFYWPSCELRRPLTASTSDTTAYWTVAPRDEDGTILTGGFLIGVTNRSGKTELMWVAAGTVAADGLSATVVRGIDIMGPDYTVGSSDFVYALESGSPVFCAVSPNIQNLIVQALQGGVGTGANLVKVGDGTDADIYYYAYNADGSKPYIRYKASTNQWEISNDGTSSYVPGTGAGSITGGDGISVTSGDIDVDLTDTTVFVQTSSGAGDAGKVARLAAGTGKFATGFITAGPLASYISDVTATADQLNSVAAGQFTQSFTTAEAVTADNALALLPIEVEYFAQLTDANLALGDSNVRRKHAIKFIPTATTSTLTTMQFRAAEAVNGATTLGNLTISIQTDSAGAPSGTAISNGTANVITQVTQRTWNTTQASRTATWATPPTLTAGTTYWLVFEVAATDATNYLNISVNSSHDENYITFTRLTYNLDTATWGTSTTNATPFFWFNNQTNLLGFGVVPTDASWGARTWNFIGFAVATAAANASVSVYYNVVPDLAGLTPGANYYLSETAGAITTTPPTGAKYIDTTAPTAFIYKIGRAFSSTQLKIEPGVKRVFIQQNTTLSATTTRQYAIWFKPEALRIFGAGLGNTDNLFVSGGFDHGTSGGSVYGIVGPVTNGGGTGGGSNSLDIGSGYSGNNMVGSASYTNAGFTYTFTETGTASVVAVIEATQG